MLEKSAVATLYTVHNSYFYKCCWGEGEVIIPQEKLSTTLTYCTAAAPIAAFQKKKNEKGQDVFMVLLEETARFLSMAI